MSYTSTIVNTANLWFSGTGRNWLTFQWGRTDQSLLVSIDAMATFRQQSWDVVLRLTFFPNTSAPSLPPLPSTCSWCRISDLLKKDVLPQQSSQFVVGKVIFRRNWTKNFLRAATTFPRLQLSNWPEQTLSCASDLLFGSEDLAEHLWPLRCVQTRRESWKGKRNLIRHLKSIRVHLRKQNEPNAIYLKMMKAEIKENSTTKILGSANIFVDDQNMSAFYPKGRHTNWQLFSS
jgi:hypothetical protein